MSDASPRQVWTVAESKARLSEILRLSEEEGPQYIGKRKSFVVVPAEDWDSANSSPRPPMGQWLVANVPRGLELELPSRSEPGREIPFFPDADV